MKKLEVEKIDRAGLIEAVTFLEQRLITKNIALYTTRRKLQGARVKIKNLKGTVAFQRKRILELYAT